VTAKLRALAIWGLLVDFDLREERQWVRLLTKRTFCQESAPRHVAMRAFPDAREAARTGEMSKVGSIRA
jgi:hypothetical protein